MYYVPQPTETARLIQTLLAKEDTREFHPEPKASNKIGSEIGSEEVGYDVRGIVRDVLR